MRTAAPPAPSAWRERLAHRGRLAHVDLAGQPDEDEPLRLLRDLDLDHSSPGSAESNPVLLTTFARATPGTLRRK